MIRNRIWPFIAHPLDRSWTAPEFRGASMGGGFMLTSPPMRVYDIWRDPFFDVARNKPERLLIAALDYELVLRLH